MTLNVANIEDSNLRQTDGEMNTIFLGNLYTCKKCGLQRGIINGNDYSINQYQELADYYNIKWNCIENGKSLFTICIDENIICPNCIVK